MDAPTRAQVRDTVRTSSPQQGGEDTERRKYERQGPLVEGGTDSKDAHLCGRTPDRRPWSRIEDECLTRMVFGEGIKQWSMIAGSLCTEMAGTLRSGRECRERWLEHLDPSLKTEGTGGKEWEHWAEEDLKIRDTRLSMGDRWADIAKLLKGRTDDAVKHHCPSTMCRDIHGKHKIGDSGSSGRRDCSASVGNATLTSPRPGGKGNGLGDRTPPLDAAQGDGGWECVQPSTDRYDGSEPSLDPGRRNTCRAEPAYAHGGLSTPDSPSEGIGLGPSVVPTSSPSTGVAAPTVSTAGQWQVSDQRLQCNRPEPRPLPKTDTISKGNKRAAHDAIFSGSGLVADDADDWSRHPPPTTTSASVTYYSEDNVAYSQQMLAHNVSDSTFHPLTAPASSVGSLIVEEQQSNSKRPRPRLFVNTNVDAGFYMAREPQGAEGGKAVYNMTTVTAPIDTRAGLAVSGPTTGSYYSCPRRMDSSTAAEAAAVHAETAALYGGSIRPPPMTSMYHHPLHYQHHHHSQQQQKQQQQQQQYIVGVGQPGGLRGYAGEHPMAIPGTSVRRYMHMQLLLALMTTPGMNVVTTAKMSWDRLGYYPVDVVCDPPAPGSKPSFPRGLPPRYLSGLPLPAIPLSSKELTHLTNDVEPPPSKRLRSFKEPESGNGGSNGGGDGRTGMTALTVSLPNTGAMAMPPAQHSPRTSAILSGLLGTESDMMLGDAGEIPYQAQSPTAFMGMGIMEPISPSYFSSPGELGVEERGDGGGKGRGGSGRGGGGGSSDGGKNVDDDGQHFDFVTAFGGGSQGIMPGFPDFGPICSPKPVSPAFGTGRLSPLAGALSPSSLSPRLNWTSGF